MPYHPHAPGTAGTGLLNVIDRDAVVRWYEAHARDLPWRSPDRTPWGVLVSEVMLQQTPVTRVVPVWSSWLDRWPAPAALAAEPPAEAIRAWGRLGYPRRALRLHGAAAAIVERHGGSVPARYDDLRALPGVGEYTAAAVATFAFDQRHVVLDTNVRRVLARAISGRPGAGSSPTAAERSLAASLLPSTAAPRWSIAVMELGALVCTAQSPRCGACPIAAGCAWQLAGAPRDDGPRRSSQPWAGTDRKARGRLMAVLRAAPAAVSGTELESAWPDDAVQRERALDSLVADGLVEAVNGTSYRLPTSPMTK
ncbi:MAG TPA: A/G-specific adenine glycosylase [Jiangellales bacterium]|nr:A/G-specific adenine glycosylase [Jiangellales bacterium]